MENKFLHDQVRKLVAAVEKLAGRIVAMESTMQELSNDITATYLTQHHNASNVVPMITATPPPAAKYKSGKLRRRR